MVEEGDSQYTAGLDEARGEGAVLGRRRRIPARVIVPADDGRRTLPHGGAEHLPGVHCGACECSSRNGIFAEKPVLGVEKKYPKLLVREP